MSFTLASFAPYRDAVFALSEGDVDVARREFLKCLEEARKESVDGSCPLVSGLLQRRAAVEARDGNREGAEALLEESLLADRNSPLALLGYAKALAVELGDLAAASAMLDRTESLLTSAAWQTSDDDLPRESYERRIAELRAEVRQRDAL